MNLRGIAVKNHSEIALFGSASSPLEHLSSPYGGGVVLIHDGTDWDNTKGFFIEQPSDGSDPWITSASYLPNGNLALTGNTNGGAVLFGGIALPQTGTSEMFHGEITPQGVGVSVVPTESSGNTIDNIHSTMPNGTFVITGLYNREMVLFNADGAPADTIAVHPVGSSRDQMYFAFYDASGTLMNVEYAFNGASDLDNIDIVCNDSYFYALTSGNLGLTTSNAVTHAGHAPVIFKFDANGTLLWSKQHEGTDLYQSGDELLMSPDGNIITICGLEDGTSDLDFNAGTVILSGPTSYWCEYNDATLVAPVAAFSGTPLNIVQGESVSFTDESVAETNAIVSWDWAFGDGGTSSLQNPTYQYNASGLFNVTLIVSDGSLSDTLFVADYINSNVQSLSIDPGSATVPASAGNTSFSVTSNGDWSISESLNWVTISPSSGSGNQSITVNYLATDISTLRSGDITVLATASGFTELFTLNQAGASVPTVDFYADSNEVDSGQVIQFTADITYPAGSLSITEWHWDFHDPLGENGGISTVENPAYWFHLVGVHDVSLTVTLSDDTKIEELKVAFMTINTGIEMGNLFPVETSLEQNYPNPFNPTTTIRLQANQDVQWESLGIYNANGQLVESINVDRLFGSQNIELDMSKHFSGVYFMHAVSIHGRERTRFTKKMTLMK